MMNSVRFIADLALRLWNWLENAPNSAALQAIGSLLSVAVGITTIIVLWVTWRAINEQSKAAKAQALASEQQAKAAEKLNITSERAALAAENQAKAADAASAASEAQRQAIEESARAERTHSALVRHQLLAQLRPVLVFTVFTVQRDPETPSIQSPAIENHGTGIALNIKAKLAMPSKPKGKGMQELHLGMDVLGPARSSSLIYDQYTTNNATIYLFYDSLDGRHFVTTANVSGTNFKDQKPFEVDEKNGCISEPPIPPIDE